MALCERRLRGGGRAHAANASAAPCRPPLFCLKLVLQCAPRRVLQDSGSQVLWWVISMCDPAASTPGQPELQGVGKEDSWPKFRNIILRWAAEFWRP